MATDEELSSYRTELKKMFDKAQTLEEAVGLTVGAASTTWSSLDKAGVYDNTRATIIVEELVAAIKLHVSPWAHGEEPWDMKTV